MPYTRLSGTGVGIPSLVRTNDDLAKIVETSDEWIRTRTGIRERRIIDLENGETHQTISVAAARQAIERAGVDKNEIDLLICATLSPNTVLPSAAPLIAAELGLPGSCGAFDLNAACSGFVSALHMADGVIRAGLNKKVVVIGSEALSSFLNWQDRSTCVIFGDGAGAAVLEATEGDPAKDSLIIASKLYSVPDKSENLAMQAGGSRSPYGCARYGDKHSPYIRMENGQEIFKLGTRCMAQAAHDVLKMVGYSLRDVDWFVPHQANLRIIEMLTQMLEFPKDKVYVNVDRWGNTSAGTVAICLGEMQQQGLLKKGQLVLLDVFGGGYTYGAMLLRW